MTKPLSQRLLPCNDAVLVRKPDAALTSANGKVKKLALVETDEETGKRIVVEGGAPRKRSIGIVVAMGRGEENLRGELVPPDPNIVVGATVAFNASASFQFADLPEMADEGLYFVPMSAIITRIVPE